MKHKTTLLVLITSCYAYAEKKETYTFDAHKITYTLKEELKRNTKPIIATTSIGLGTYVLYDSIQTAIDLHKTDQHNSEKIIILNTLIATGFIAFGSYLAKQLKHDNSDIKN